jgi:tetratricopeptide (TPR) repeat protein
MQEAFTGASTAAVSRQAVEAELQRILESQRFLKSEGLREFLRLIVESALDGNSDQLKESVIAVEAFGRKPSFDPRLDAIVRVQAARLRTALRDFYDSEGATDELLIEVPKGGYAPLFSLRTAQAPESAPEPFPVSPLPQPEPPTLRRRFRRWLPVSLAAALIAALLAGLFWFRQHRSGPLSEADIVVVADFENSTDDPVFTGTIKEALMIDLEQTPFLNILPERRAQELRKLMRRPEDEPLSGDVALELCRRAGARAVISGSIASVGRLYVIGLTASDCLSGDPLLREQQRADGKEQVLNAVDRAAAGLRARLGESLANREKYSRPLESVTTSSLKALQSYSEGVEMRNARGDAAAIPFFLRAVELDPEFAMAYSQLGNAYFDSMKPDPAKENFRKAFSLRDRVSQRERYYIESRYYHFVTADLDKVLVVYQAWNREFPRDVVPINDTAMVHTEFGDYEQAAQGFNDALRADPSRAYLYTNLAEVLICLNRRGEAHALLDEMRNQHLEDTDQLIVAYQLAFLEGDAAEMRRQVALSTGKTEVEEVLLVFEAQSAVGQGRMADARRLIHQASALALGLEAPDRAATWLVQGALFEAETGNHAPALEQAGSALHLSRSKDTVTLAALAMARAGDQNQAQALAAELHRQYPQDTILNNYWLPAISAAVDLGRGQPEQAIEALEVTRRYQSGQPSSYQVLSIAPLYPVYLRGLAYRMAGQPAQAAAQFQMLSSHPELTLNYPLGALVRSQ